MIIQKKIKRVFLIKFLRSGIMLMLGVMVVFITLFIFEAYEKRDLYIQNSKQESDNLQRNMGVQFNYIMNWLTFYIESESISSIYSGEKDKEQFVYENFRQWVKGNGILSTVILYNNDGEKILGYSEETDPKKKELFIKIKDRVLKNLKKNDYHIFTKFSQNENNIYTLHFIPIYLGDIKKGYIAAVMDSKQFMISHENNYRKGNNHNNTIGIATMTNNKIKGILLNEKNMDIKVYEANYKSKSDYLVTENGSYIIVSRNLRKVFEDIPTLKKYKIKYDKDTIEGVSMVIIDRPEVMSFFIDLLKKYITIYTLSIILILPLFYKYQKVAFENDLRKRRLRVKAIKLNKNVTTMNTIVSIVAHDIKGPFTSLLGTFSLINRKGKNLKIDQLRQYLKLMEIECKKAYHFSENLMKWASSQNGIDIYNPKKINLYTIILKNVKEYEGMGELKEIKIKISIPKDFICYSDENILETVIRNVLINAIKFTPNGGSINIQVRENNKMAIVIIEDTGIGMSKDTLKKLRNEVSHTTLGSSGELGNGMGILLIKRLCKVNKGKLYIESELGSGTKISISIPKEV